MAQLVDPCLPSHFFCMGYGGGIIHSNNLYNGSVFHHHHHNTLSPPPPPPPPHSALSLEPPPSSPPCSSLAETFPYDIWPASADSLPLDTPPYLDNIILSASSGHSIRKRAAVPELEDLGASPILCKRLCGMTDLDSNGACISRDSSTSLPDEISANSHDNTVNNGDFGPGMEDSRAFCSDLEDVLDILLEEVGTAVSSPIGHGSSMGDWKSEINPLNRASKSPDCDYPGLQKGVSESRTTLQQLLSGQGINKRAPYSFEELKQEVSSVHHQLQWPSSSRWAGPTLLDIESALAMTSSPSTPTSHSSSVSSPFGEPLKNLSFLQDILREETALSHSCCKEELSLKQDDSTWRRLQKRNHLEPRYTVKIRCEEGAGNDGYRWRKYGQKSIKNSPYPRSYYRCTSGKCSVKKQVERCHEDASLFVVTYEGIHLHHQPNSLGGLHSPHLPMPPFDKKTPHTFSPPSPPTPHSCASSPSTNPHVTPPLNPHVTPPSQPSFLPSSPPLPPPPLSQHIHPPSTPPLLTVPSASPPPLCIT